MSATRPLNMGDPTDVPFTTKSEESASRNPLTQLPREQIRYPTWSEADKATSGTSRTPSEGTPGPCCQVGFAKTELLPPPPPESVVSANTSVSFQGTSGMYETADPLPAVFEVVQYLLSGTSYSVVPPTPVTYGRLAGMSTVNPSCTNCL